MESSKTRSPRSLHCPSIALTGQNYKNRIKSSKEWIMWSLLYLHCSDLDGSSHAIISLESLTNCNSIQNRFEMAQMRSCNSVIGMLVKKQFNTPVAGGDTCPDPDLSNALSVLSLLTSEHGTNVLGNFILDKVSQIIPVTQLNTKCCSCKSCFPFLLWPKQEGAVTKVLEGALEKLESA